MNLFILAIVDEGLENPKVLQFLEHIRDEFKKVARKGSRGSPASFNLLHLQDQTDAHYPLLDLLVNNWILESPLPHSVGLSPSPSDMNGQMEALYESLIVRKAYQAREEEGDEGSCHCNERH